jgi:hypothetical protein
MPDLRRTGLIGDRLPRSDLLIDPARADTGLPRDRTLRREAPKPMIIGPVQILVAGFGSHGPSPELLAEFRRLRDYDVVRLLDLLLIRADDRGVVQELAMTALSWEERESYGAFARALVGTQGSGIPAQAESPDPPGPDPVDLWSLADVVPPGTTAAVALFEHRWAIPLRDLLLQGSGQTLADTWVHRSDLVAASAAAAGAQGSA